MKRIDENTRQKLQAINDRNAHLGGGILQNRISQRSDEPWSNQQKTEEVPNIVRHGYGVQYWTDGAHYEG